jgi:hypothetical protein
MLSPLYGQISPLRVPTTDIAMLAANAYIAAVEAADGQSLESGVKSAFTDFIVGCHNDGIWTALKSSCILAGARTLSGALVPLVGTAPTNANFVSADYNRETGMKGDGLTKYLNPNRNNNADPQNSKHVSVNLSEMHTGTASQWFIASGDSGAGQCAILFGSASYRFNSINGSGLTSIVSPSSGFKGANRNNSASFERRNATSTLTVTDPSRTPLNAAFNVFRRASGNYTNARLSFYSIGESLDLALLDTRVSTLMTDIAAAI